MPLRINLIEHEVERRFIGNNQIARSTETEGKAKAADRLSC
jgi:hypothetical protein